ncbi:DUF2024 family protein [Tamlana sp. 2201CG12-4]|uniref:DUF2024 family protein n=1 Tax=Tamlana sp. 2201CG12-4 TaxID=3112582 RepID=UPI002DBD762A|nr:DUF2024 family protein [Tamlana sp. 2201CG12-4]MEC3906662.1 DUF2024 family protein [Tamlana sp. 2201CG12-4]
MKVSVWDTYVRRKDSKLMHFDILVPNAINDEKTILEYGETYLKGKPFETERLNTKICNFCHIEEATDVVKRQIENTGFSIIEMENCN